MARWRWSRRCGGGSAHRAKVAKALVGLFGIDNLGEESVVATPHARTGDLLAALHAQALEGSRHGYLAADPARRGLLAVSDTVFAAAEQIEESGGCAP